MALKEYKPGTTFTGRVERAVGESEPAWPAPLRAKEVETFIRLRFMGAAHLVARLFSLAG
jgi:hypothetical protein